MMKLRKCSGDGSIDDEHSEQWSSSQLW